MDNLEFQDFHESKVDSVQVRKDEDSDEGDIYEFHHKTNDTGKLLPGGANNNNPNNLTTPKSMMSFEYYQQFFDVDTTQVVSRLLYSCIPSVKSNFIAQHIRPQPDLYGPFWVCVTLVFSVSISGNLASYIQTAGQDHNWHYNFHHVSGAAGVISAYVLLVPAALHLLCWYRTLPSTYTYLELLCAYGYSMSIFVPVSMLWVVNFDWFRWSLILVAVCVSGSGLVGSIWAAVKDDKKMIAYGIVCGVFFLHFLLAVSFKQFFFASDGPSSSTVSTNAANFGSLPMVNPTLSGTALDQKLKSVQQAVTKESMAMTTKANAGGDTNAINGTKSVTADLPDAKVNRRSVAVRGAGRSPAAVGGLNTVIPGGGAASEGHKTILV